MEAERWDKLKALFDEALDLPAEGREAFLTQACAGNPDLAEELRTLLQEYESPEDLFSTPALNLREAAIAERPPQFDPGAVLASRFRICRFIARGGMGEVYEAEDLELQERVALKIIRREIAGDERTLNLFKQEIQVARRVTHPNVCRIFDLGQHSERSEAGTGHSVHFLSMEFLEGESLSHRLRTRGPFSPKEAILLIGQMAAALQAAHSAGVIHRDFKPANVILVPEGDTGGFRVVVTDFGVAVPLHLAGGGSPSLSPRAGTPGYMAPELFEEGPVSRAADVYSLGLVIAELVGGEVHPAGDAVVLVEPRLQRQTGASHLRLPPALDPWRPVLLRCLERSPEKRFGQPMDVFNRLKELEQRRHRPQRRRLLIAAAAVLVVPLLLQPFLPVRFRPLEMIKRLLPDEGGAGTVLAFQNRDWVLITKFDNRTGEAALDGTMEYILQRDLSNSRYVNVVSSDRVQDALTLMQLAPDTPVDIAVGREICQRDGAIRALLAGRIEEVGGVYELSLQVIDPNTGVVVDSNHEDAVTPEGLLASVRVLSNWARERLGESLNEIAATGQALEKVTTPSLNALKAYTLADGMIRGNGNPEPLLREALKADPTFASAENLLAWVLRNAGKPKEEFMPHAVRAKELSVHSTPRERLFIEASYYGHSGDEERSHEGYATLLRAFPDHFWAANNLAIYHLNREQWDQALPFILRAADLRPILKDFNGLSALLLVQRKGDVRQAGEYAARFQGESIVDNGYLPQIWDDWALVFPVHQAWVEGNIEEARRKLLQLTEILPVREGYERHRLATCTGLAFLMLGEFGKAEECFQHLLPVMPEGIPWKPLIVALAKEDPDELKNRVGLITKEMGKGVFFLGTWDRVWATIVDELPIMLLARAGFVSETDEILQDGGERLSSPGWAFVRGEVALARGDYPTAIDNLGTAIRYREAVPWYESPYFDVYFMGVESLS
ncbi:MAG: protein kinase, partial [Acidobacteriota bacterium]